MTKTPPSIPDANDLDMQPPKSPNPSPSKGLLKATMTKDTPDLQLDAATEATLEAVLGVMRMELDEAYMRVHKGKDTTLDDQDTYDRAKAAITRLLIRERLEEVEKLKYDNNQIPRFTWHDIEDRKAALQAQLEKEKYE